MLLKDWLRDLRVQHYVNELFFEHNNVDDQRNRFVAVEHKAHSVGKMGTNLMFDPAQEALLETLNQFDGQLYWWMRDLVFNRTRLVWETARENARNRNELVYDLGYERIVRHSESVSVVYDLPGKQHL